MSKTHSFCLHPRTASSSHEKSFNFNYIWTFLWTKHCEMNSESDESKDSSHKMHNRPLASLAVLVQF